MQDINIGVQLYSVRELTARDFTGTLAKVAAIGYRAVELAGFGNLTSIQEVRAALEAGALTCVSAHVPIEQLETELNRVLDDNAELDNRHIVVPFLPEERRKTLADWQAVTASLNQIGSACRERGFQLAYHHHDFEFQKIDEQVPFDLIWRDTDPRVLKAQLDVYWLQKSGRNSVKVIRDLGSRVSMLHLKDMDRSPERRFAPLGQGLLVFPKIFEAAGTVGVPWAIVEQDETYGIPPLDALKTSFDYLQSLNRI